MPFWFRGAITIVRHVRLQKPDAEGVSLPQSMFMQKRSLTSRLVLASRFFGAGSGCTFSTLSGCLSIGSVAGFSIASGMILRLRFRLSSQRGLNGFGSSKLPRHVMIFIASSLPGVCFAARRIFSLRSNLTQKLQIQRVELGTAMRSLKHSSQEISHSTQRPNARISSVVCDTVYFRRSTPAPRRG